MAVRAARAALDRLRALALVDADGLRERLIGAEAAVHSRELQALALYGGEMTELADRMLADRVLAMCGPQDAPTAPLARGSRNAGLIAFAPALDVLGCGAPLGRSACTLD